MATNVFLLGLLDKLYKMANFLLEMTNKYDIKVYLLISKMFVLLESAMVGRSVPVMWRQVMAKITNLALPES